MTTSIWLIRNRRTNEAMYFEVRETLLYLGQEILYGEGRPHQIKIYRGVREWEGKPTAFPRIRRDMLNNLAWSLTILSTGGDEGRRRAPAVTARAFIIVEVCA